jgi:nitroimidazol reductase NimA-like FMN-containing flavoprotein (pyridoxamine 5'-phosphate oxidase superfamily)
MDPRERDLRTVTEHTDDADDEVMLVDEGLEILTEDECWRLIEMPGIGRVGVTVGALPAIFPVNYTAPDRTIVFRTADGTKLRAAVEHAVVVFEVDHADPLYHNGWSVQVVGVAEPIDGSGGDGDVAALHAAVAPWAPGERSNYVRIRPEMVSGRRITREAPAT